MKINYGRYLKGEYVMSKAIRFVLLALCFFMLLPTVACVPSNNDKEGGINISNLTVRANKIPLKLWYDEQAPFINEGSEEASMMAGQDIGWQNWSLPIGNGYVGANVCLVQGNVECKAHGFVINRCTSVRQFDIFAFSALVMAVVHIEVPFVRIHQGNSALHTSGSIKK
jgi:hypothetical protein